MVMRFLLLGFLLFSSSGVPFLLAQPTAIQAEVDRYLKQAEELTFSHPDKAAAAAQAALALARKNRLLLPEGKAYQRLARIHAEQGDYTRALEMSRAGIAIFRRLNQPEQVCRTYVGVGVINRYLKLYPASIEAYRQAEAIAQKYNLKPMLAAVYGNLGNVYFDQGDYEKALQYHLKSLPIDQALGNEQGVGNTYHNIGMIYRVQKRYGKALAFYNRSLAIDFKNGNLRNVSISNIDLSRLYMEQRLFQQALPHAQEALRTARQSGSKSLEKDALSLLPLIYAALGKEALALSYHHQHNQLADSLQSAELSQQIADMQAKYQGEQKDYELETQKLRLEAQQASLGQQRTLIATLIILALLATLISYLLFNRYKLRQRNQQLMLANEQYRLAQSLQLRQDIDDTINYFATSLYGKNTVDEILWDVAKNCVARLGFVDCVIYLLNAKGTTLIQKAAYGNKNPEAYAILDPIEIPLGEGIVGNVARSGQPEIVADTTQDPRYVVDDAVRHSELAVPLLLQNEVIGVIDSEHPEKGFFHNHHLDALQTIAAICSSKIAQAMADEEAKKAKIAQLEADYSKKLDRVKSQFFANISHEFRTPLQLILAPLQKPGEISAEEIKLVTRNANRLLRLVNQLLDLSKAETGLLAMQYQRGHVVPFLQQITAYFEPLAAAKQVQYRVELPNMDPLVVYDADKLEKIVYNLLSNAIKFTPTNGQVSVVIDLVPETGLQLTVSDTGIGIPDDLQRRIFDRFYQVDTTQTRAFEGSGIGLALTKELVDLYGGTIAVESRVGVGSTFLVRLPLQADAPLTTPVPFREVPTPDLIAAEAISTRPLREDEVLDNTGAENKPMLLLVEDHPELNEYLRQQLTKEYRVVAATQGEEGLHIARQMVPDVIISDVMMPMMDGFTMTRHLKEDELTSHIPVILLTAKDDTTSRKEGFEGGAEQYLAKPFALDELVVRINRVLAQREVLRRKYSREVVLQPTGAPVRDREAEFLEKIVRVIEQYLSDETFSVEILQREMGMSRMQLHRKLKALTDQSASDFIRYIRLQRAADLLQQPGTPVAEAAYLSGFTHLSYFSKCFKEQFGVLPSEYARSNHEN